jgi:type IV pilus assembly protein PilX
LRALNQLGAAQRGVSLIIVLIMLGVIALMSAATLRNASSNERVSNNFRMQVLAQQYAEAGLRYCETQLTLADADRVETLREANLVASSGSASPAWQERATWNGAGGHGGAGAARASRTTVPAAYVVSSGGAFKPGQLPECLAEKQALEGGAVYVITARGFSPDYTADARGFSVTGSVLWLQTSVLIERSVATDPAAEENLSAGTLKGRTWRRILNPPIH